MNYMLLIYGDQETMAQATPEQSQAMADEYEVFTQSIRGTGQFLDTERQAHVRELMPAAPDFAGTLAVTRLSCGNACVEVLLIDWRNGKVLAPPQLSQITQDLPCRGDETILFRRDSRLLSVTRKRNGGIATQYFVWKTDASALIQTAEYQRSIERYCSLQSP